MSEIIEHTCLRLGKFNCDDAYTSSAGLEYVSDDGVVLKNRDFAGTALWRSFEVGGKEYVEYKGVKYWGVSALQC